MEFIPVVAIHWIEAAGNYVKVHCRLARRAGADHALVAGRNGSIRRPLPGFTDRSVVNLALVREMHPWYGGDYTAVLTDGRELRVSSRRYEKGCSEQ